MNNIAGTRKIVKQLLFVVIMMFGFGFAMVPLYDILCDVTGCNGKTAGKYTPKKEQEIRADRLVTVQFLASNNANMPWEFRPKVRSMKVNPGKLSGAEFYARNISQTTMVGQAVPSVTPFHAAEFLHKTECFCFERQELANGEELIMPLRFIVDSKIPENVKTLTLSYTLYDVTEQIGLAKN
jgi:cytochrome c oxidase assembly protein subunit 11